MEIGLILLRWTYDNEVFSAYNKINILLSTLANIPLLVLTLLSFTTSKSNFEQLQQKGSMRVLNYLY